ncbi:MAG: hypothetical protein NTZ67_04875 [Gammaproteobacteria bacterium]|nr:hypothetical protein [Gammaproteobacteria bacterium]
MIITFSLVLAIFLLWLSCFSTPLSRQTKIIHEKLVYAEKNVADVTAIHKEYQIIVHADTPEAEKKINAMLDKLIKLQKHPLLARQIVETPDDMRNLLQAVSKTGPELSLNQEQSLAATPVKTDPPSVLQNQKIALEFDGSYFETIRYIEYLEKLPWYISFDSLNYQVQEYPNAKINIVMSVLSSTKGVGHH